MAASLLPRRAVAALFLARQHLARPRTRRLTASSLVGLRGGRGGAADRLHQRGRARPPPHPVEPLRALRPRGRGEDRLPPAAALRVLGPRRLPRACVALPGLAPGDARLLRAQPRLGRLAEDEPPRPAGGRGRDRRRRPPGQRRLRAPARPGLVRGLVELEARRARPRLPVDERAHARPLPLALPQELRPVRAGDARGCRERAADAGGFPPVAPAAVAARPGGGQRDRPADVPHLPAPRRRRAATGPARRPRSGRGRGGRGRGRARPPTSRSPRTCPPSPLPAGGGAPPRGPLCCRPSTRSSGTGTARAACSASTTRWRSTRRATGGSTATTRCRSSTTASSWAGSTPRRTAPSGGSRSGPSTSSPGSRRGTRRPPPPGERSTRMLRSPASARRCGLWRPSSAPSDVTLGRVTPAALAPALRRAVKG